MLHDDTGLTAVPPHKFLWHSKQVLFSILPVVVGVTEEKHHRMYERNDSTFHRKARVELGQVEVVMLA